MQDLRDFWKEQDMNPVPFTAAVQRAHGTLNAEGWKGLLAAVEGLVLLRTMEHMTKGVTSPLDLDKYQHAIRTASLGYAQPTGPQERPRRRRRPASEAAPVNAWGPRELACIMAFSTGDVTPENIAPGSAAALHVIRLLRAGLAASQTRQSKTRASLPARDEGGREQTSASRR